MAVKLQCEVCGGKLIGKPGGIFECEYCGTEYSTEWAKAKIQEIRGTVRVEGPVSVTGSVSIEGAATANSLLKRGFLHLEDRNFTDALECFNRVLDINPEAPDAYLGRLLVGFEATSLAELARHTHSPIGNIDYQRAFQYGGESLRGKLRETVAGAKTNFLAERQYYMNRDNSFQLSLHEKSAFDFIGCTGGNGPDALDIASSGRDDMQYAFCSGDLIVTTESVVTIMSILPSLEQAVRNKKNVILLCRDWTEDLVNTLALNAKRQVVSSFIIKGLKDQDFQAFQNWAGCPIPPDGIFPNISLDDVWINQDFLLICK